GPGPPSRHDRPTVGRPERDVRRDPEPREEDLTWPSRSGRPRAPTPVLAGGPGRRRRSPSRPVRSAAPRRSRISPARRAAPTRAVTTPRPSVPSTRADRVTQGDLVTAESSAAFPRPVGALVDYLAEVVDEQVDEALLVRALTHRSYAYAHSGCLN